MKIIRRILSVLAVVCIIMGIILAGVAMVTGSGFEAIMNHGTVDTYIALEIDYLVGLFNQAKTFVTSFIVLG